MGEASYTLPHRELVDIFRAEVLVAEEAAAAVVRVDLVIERVFETGEEVAELEQEPKAGLHPEPQ